MATSNQESQAALCEEILAEARHESEQAIRQARLQAEAILARAASEAELERRQRLDVARAEARRRTELILASVAVEVGRLNTNRVEALLEGIHQQARARLESRQGFDYRDALVALAAQAVSRMAGEAFLVKLSGPDRLALGDGTAQAIARRAGRSPLRIELVDEPTLREGGVIITDLAGTQVWDNRLSARLERTWPELRRQIAVRTALVPVTKPTGDGQ